MRTGGQSSPSPTNLPTDSVLNITELARGVGRVEILNFCPDQDLNPKRLDWQHSMPTTRPPRTLGHINKQPQNYLRPTRFPCKSLSSCPFRMLSAETRSCRKSRRRFRPRSRWIRAERPPGVAGSYSPTSNPRNTLSHCHLQQNTHHSKL